MVGENKITGWRKSKCWERRAKNLSRNLSRITRSGGKNKFARQKEAARKYLRVSRAISLKVKASKLQLLALPARAKVISGLEALRYYEGMLDKHIDLVERRIIKGEKIPHRDKLFSIFETYTEWINKGKSGNRVELGLKIALCTDQYGFILAHRVMEKEEDVEAAVPIVKSLKEKYQTCGSDKKLESVSFDKGYWSKENYEILKKEVNQLVMPKKGKRNKDESERESNKSFKLLRKQHSAVESNINSLEHHGLNRCPEKGIINFRKYTALGIAAYNIHLLGNLLKTAKIKQKKKLLPKAA